MAEQKVEKQKMSKPMRIALTVMGSLLAAVIVCFVILAFIPVKGLSHAEINDYLYVNVYDYQNERITSVQKTGSVEKDADISALLADGAEYTAFRAAFEQVYKGKLRFKTEEISEEEQQYDENGYPEKDDAGLFVTKTVTKTERVTVGANEIVSKTQAAGGKFALEFIYTDGVTVTENKKITVEGEVIEFDRMRVVILDSKNELAEFELYFYDDDDPAEITPVLVNANSTVLYGNLCAIKKAKTGVETNGETDAAQTPAA